jgi:DNA polymerase-1
VKTIALIDGDIFAYEAAAAAETPINWGDDLWTLHAFETPAKQSLVDRIESLAEDVEADRIIIALSDTENFRKKILPTYKLNRAGVRKPMLLKPLKEFMGEKFEVFIRPGLEGDDVLGILSTWPKLVGRKVIISKDKDFRTIPGEVFYANRADEGILTITEEEADRFHLYQTLTGDTTDGYSGCPGIGPVTAEKILDKAVADGVPLWDAVVATYAKKNLGEEEALTQARVARILRASDYDFKNKEPILWTP